MKKYTVHPKLQKDFHQNTLHVPPTVPFSWRDSEQNPLSVRGFASSRKTTQPRTWKLDVVVNEPQCTASGRKHLFADAPYLVSSIPYSNCCIEKETLNTFLHTQRRGSERITPRLFFCLLLKRSSAMYVQKAPHAESVSEHGAQHKLRQSCCSEHPTYNLETERRGGGRGLGV